ncbi:MAG: hypothetical protein H6705_01835 [Myxococcales bacterium]|nr:hypothetical protein [Myxococcales bacterium]
MPSMRSATTRLPSLALAALCLALAALCLVPSPAHAQCPATPFACEVDAAIDRGLDYLRDLERGTGFADGSNGRMNFLAVLALLERPTGVGWQGIPRGFAGLDPIDQALHLRLMHQLIAQDPALQNPNAIPYTYVTGGNLVALTAHLTTGGPDDVGAAVTVSDALANGVAALHRNQGNIAPGNVGGWNYNSPNAEGDLSTTHFAVTGLAAAAALVDGADEPLDRAVDFLVTATHVDGGAGYRTFDPSSSTSMTAALLWCLRIAGVPAGDPRAQAPLGWLHEHYQVDRMIGTFNPTSLYYALWTTEKALGLSFDDGLGGLVYAEDFAHRVPADHGHPEEPPGVYYDIAITLLGWQDPANGLWGNGFGGSPNGWNELSSHVFSLLTLYRTGVGFGCLDDDDDGICRGDDNCPAHDNPAQEDRDGDGVGDACDLCPDDPDPAQHDGDGDGQGDACDPLLCVPDGHPEVCDGVDNDCDGLVDARADGEPVFDAAPCEPARADCPGRVDCRDGALTCDVVERGEGEACDLTDDDCDGTIDEGTRNACGFCGPPLPEACDGIDDDCDGATDEAAPCPDGLACREGACAAPCLAGQCAAGERCVDGACVPLCAGVRCDPGARCDPATGACVDPCQGVPCRGGVCIDGECWIGDCQHTGCPQRQLCRAGACAPDPCQDVACAAGEACRDGACHPSCAPIACLDHERCLDGACHDARCGGARCAPRPLRRRRLRRRPATRRLPRRPDLHRRRLRRRPLRRHRCPTGERCVIVADTAQCAADWLAPARPSRCRPQRA